jgi:hypothetical protein
MPDTKNTTETKAMRETKEWTLMFYFASDNPLAPTIVSQLKAIKDAGFHPEANVIAHFDPHSVNVPTHTFDVNHINKLKARGKSKVGFTANDPFVRDLVLDKLWGEADEKIRNYITEYLNKPVEHGTRSPAEESRDGGGELEWGALGEGIVYDPPVPSAEMSGELDPQKSLAAFLEFCRGSYPARHYMLFILGHGLVVGNDSFLFDEYASKHALLLTELGEELRAFNGRIAHDREPGQMELVGFHSCSMSGLEVACELKGAANYMMASQGPAYVGSWPYRHILLHLFNNMNAHLTVDDLTDPNALIAKLRSEDAVATVFRDRFAPETLERLHIYDDNQPPSQELLAALVKDLDRLLGDPELGKAEALERDVQLSVATSQLRSQRLRGVNLRRLNRLLLCDAFPQEIERHPTINIKRMLTKIFSFCLHHSYDFHLAGYSFDLCLCDLSKVPKAMLTLNDLSDKLIKGLDEKAISQLLLLAHWDAQSFWQEDYVDLYDFCFRFRERCEEARPDIRGLPATDTLKAIYDACDRMMGVLQRGSKKVTDKLIVRSGFVGPAYQYSHGFSIFFPWAEPVGSKLWDKEYERYKLNQQTSWRKFLEKYFKETKRQTHREELERDRYEESPAQDFITEDVLAFLQAISARVLDDHEPLTKHEPGKYGPDDPMGKHGPNDPMGVGCNCPTIKNYPRFTRPREKDGEKAFRPDDPLLFSLTFAEGFKIK